MSKQKLIYGAVALAVVLIAWNAVQSPDNGNPTPRGLTEKEDVDHGHGFAVDPNDPNKVYVATHEGLYAFQDGALSRIGNTTHDFMGFTAHPSDSRMMFTSGHPARGGNLGFLRSADSGMTWEKVSDGINGPIDFHVLSMSPMDPNLIYGWYGDMMHRSMDQGATWEAFTPDIAQPISFIPHPTDPNVLYAVTIQGVAKSSDQGDTWEYVFPSRRTAAVVAFAIDPNASDVFYLYSRQYGLEKSTDGGTTWTTIEESFESEIVTNLAIARSDSAIVYAFTKENSIFRSDDSGQAWKK